MTIKKINAFKSSKDGFKEKSVSELQYLKTTDFKHSNKSESRDILLFNEKEEDYILINYNPTLARFQAPVLGSNQLKQAGASYDVTLKDHPFLLSQSAFSQMLDSNNTGKKYIYKISDDKIQDLSPKLQNFCQDNEDVLREVFDIQKKQKTNQSHSPTNSDGDGQSSYTSTNGDDQSSYTSPDEELLENCFNFVPQANTLQNTITPPPIKAFNIEAQAEGPNLSEIIENLHKKRDSYNEACEKTIQNKEIIFSYKNDQLNIANTINNAIKSPNDPNNIAQITLTNTVQMEAKKKEGAIQVSLTPPTTEVNANQALLNTFFQTILTQKHLNKQKGATPLFLDDTKNIKIGDQEFTVDKIKAINNFLQPNNSKNLFDSITNPFNGKSKNNPIEFTNNEINKMGSNVANQVLKDMESKKAQYTKNLKSEIRI
jgi:hypothetical protein